MEVLSARTDAARGTRVYYERWVKVVSNQQEGRLDDDGEGVVAKGTGVKVEGDSMWRGRRWRILSKHSTIKRCMPDMAGLKLSTK